MPPVVIHLLAGHKPGDDVEPFVEHRGPLLCVAVIPECRELSRHASEPGPEDDSAVAQDVQRGQRIGDDLRPAAGQRGDVGTDLYALCRGGDGGEDDPRVGGRSVPHESQMVPDKEPLPSGVFGCPRQPDRFARIRISAHVGDHDAVMHYAYASLERSTSLSICLYVEAVCLLAASQPS